MDQQEYAQRTETLRPRLYRTAFLYLGSAADAQEALDEAVYRGLRHLRQLRQPEFFNTWLTRILLNVCARELKRRSRLRPVEILPETAGTRDYDALPLQEAIEKLPEELRAVIVLRFFADYTLEETARALELPRGTVTSRQSRALKLLRLELGEEAQDESECGI